MSTARHKPEPGVRLAAMFFLASAKFTRLALVPLLAFWIAGTGCLLGCEKMVAAANLEDTHLDTIVAGDSCASQKGHDCCAKRNDRKSMAVTVSETSSSIDFFLPSKNASDTFGCPLAASRAIVVGKAGTLQPPPGETIGARLPSYSSVNERRASATETLFPPNRGHTYLRCCVFLI